MEEEKKAPLDPQITIELKRILAKDSSSELTEADKDFLRARRSYIGKNSRQKFADVFNDIPQKPEEPKAKEKKKEEEPKKTEKQEEKAKEEKKVDTSQHPGEQDVDESNDVDESDDEEIVE